MHLCCSGSPAPLTPLPSCSLPAPTLLMLFSAWRRYQDMVDEVQNTQDLMDTFRSIYSSHTKLEGERLESTLRGERAITASDCMELGIIHSIA